MCNRFDDDFFFFEDNMFATINGVAAQAKISPSLATSARTISDSSFFVIQRRKQSDLFRFMLP